jgi:hypothetical protein
VRVTTLTYQDFYRMGYQDCDNTISLDEFDRTLPDAEAIRAYAAEYMPSAGEHRQAWVELTPIEDYEGLDPDKCYERWRAGWLDTAARVLARYPIATPLERPSSDY